MNRIRLKKIISIIFVILLIFQILSFMVSGEETNKGELSVSETFAVPGRIFKVKINIKNNPGMMTSKIVISYNGLLLKLQNVSFNDNIPGMTDYTNDSSGILTLNWFNQSDYYIDDFTFATITFLLSEDAETGKSIPIKIKNEETSQYNYNEEKLDFIINDGLCKISRYLPGDINGDYIVDNRDLISLLKYLSNVDIIINENVIDTNGDESVNNKDLIRLFKYLSGYDVELCMNENGEWENEQEENSQSTKLPYIGENGNWWIDGFDTGIKANSDSSGFAFASEFGILPGNVDTDKFQALLNDESLKNRTIFFADGVYTFSKQINMVSNVTLCGGANTILELDENSSSNILLYLNNVDNVKLSKLKIRGYNTTRPSQIGTKSGIWIDSCRSINLDELDIYGWSLYGLYGKTMSSYGNVSDGKMYKQLQMTNSRLYNNYYGSYLDYRCEYTQIMNCSFGENYIGSVNCGGNNMYVGCMWNVNTYGFVLNNAGSNPAHGGSNSCTFNHNTYAIQVNDCINGWTFDGCQIFYGRIDLNNSKGVIFDSSIFGSCKFYSQNIERNVNMISNSYFLTDMVNILSGNDGSTKIVDCLPDIGGTEEEEIQENPDKTLVYTLSDKTANKMPLSTNAFSGACSYPIGANTKIDYIDFETQNANANSIINGINVWAVNKETGIVTEHIIDNASVNVIYSKYLNNYVVRIEINKTYDYSVFFIVQCTRENGVSISYYYNDDNTAGWLIGDIAPKIGDVISGNSKVVPVYAVYQK